MNAAPSADSSSQQRRAAEDAQYSVLFVCTANICRSPMAMGLWKAAVQGSGEGWRIESAGVRALEGMPPAELTLYVLARRGISLEGFRSRPVTHHLLEGFNLVLTMEAEHRRVLREAYPDLAARVYLLSEMVGRGEDVEDPIGGSWIAFEATAQHLEELLRNGAPRIRQLAASSPG